MIDYLSADDLFYAVNRICANIETNLGMNFSLQKVEFLFNYF